MIKIAPSILSADFGNLAGEVRNIALWGAEIVHCDVMDGVFVPNLTFGMPIVRAVRRATEQFIDVHLMITEPEKYAVEFVRVGADAVSFHPEASKDPIALLKTIRGEGALSGFALNPNVPFEDWISLVPYADFILVMSVYAGFGGQKLIVDCLEKAKKIKSYLAKNAPHVIIEIDGGVSEDNALAVRDTGAEWIVAGSAIFGSANPFRTVQVLKGETV